MTLINADQLSTEPQKWVVRDVIPEVGFGFAHGPSTIGKSLAFGTDLGLAVANGVPWLGNNTIKGCVVYALGEGLYDAGLRKQARLAREHKDRMLAAADPEIRGNLTAEEYLASLPPYTDERLFFETTAFAVPIARTDQEGQTTMSLARAVAAMSVIPELALVILDATSDFAGGLSISNDTSASRYVAGLKWMVEKLDCAILVIGHDTADGKRMLGAGRLFNAADFVIAIQKENDITGIPAATITSQKSKYGSGFAPMSYQIEQVQWDEPIRDADGNPTWETEVVSTATVRLRELASLETAGTSLRLPNGATRRPGTQPGTAPLALPEIRDMPARRKRNGLRSGDSAPVAEPAQTAPEPAPEPAPASPEPGKTTKEVFTANLLATRCTDCGAPAGKSCLPLPGLELIPVSSKPRTDVHPSRIEALSKREPALAEKEAS